MNKLHLVYCTCACALYSPYSLAETDATASDASIETITVLGQSNIEGAYLGGIELKSLPINTHVVGREEMERIRFVDPDEFLDRIPGETQVRNLRIPDGGKGYTVPMLDGIPLENPYEGATQRLDRVNTNDIERVEIIKGPASALYPNNAFGGVVNVISRTPPTELEHQLRLEGGDYNRRRIGFSSGGSFQNVGYFFDATSRNLDGLRKEARNDRDQFSGKLVFEPTESTDVALRFEYIDEFHVARGDLTAEQIDEDNTQAGSLSSSTDLTQDTLSLSVVHQLPSGAISFDLVRREKDTVGASRFRGPQDENDLAYNGKLSYNHHLELGQIILGYEGYDGEQDTKQYGRSDLELTGPFTTFENTLAIDAYFLQFNHDITAALSLSAGLRYEDIEVGSTLYQQTGDFSDLAPKFGLTYTFESDDMLWFGASKGFYAPQAGDLFDLEEGNPDLAPEEALNLEVGYRGKWNAWQIDTSFYHNEVKNYQVTQEFIRDNGDEYEQITNAGRVTLMGIETVVEFAPQNTDWRFGLTHSYTRNRYDSFVQSIPGADDDLSGKTLRRSPDHHLNARIAWQASENLSIELEGDFYTAYFADNANSDSSRFKRDPRINLRIDYKMEQWRLWLHGLNLTDTLEDRATYSRGQMKFRTVDGRTLYAGLSYDF